MPSSEFDLIAAINERMPAPGPRVRVPSGDDAAVVEPRAASAVTVDAIVDGVHFVLDSYGHAAVGRKALAAALSDLAAMGAAQGEAYVVVATPDELSDDGLLGVADGLAEVAVREEVTIAGGDLVRAPVLMLSVTAVG
ncbi:MAG TPA: AIR synthase related protein, partial [Solirubrobacterales bacterium]